MSTEMSIKVAEKLLFAIKLETIAKFYRDNMKNDALFTPNEYDLDTLLRNYFWSYGPDAEDQAKNQAAKFCKAFPHVDKDYQSSTLSLTVPIDTELGLKIDYRVERDKVCTQVPTGETTTVRKQRTITPAVVEEYEEEEQVMEWKCEPLLKPAE